MKLKMMMNARMPEQMTARRSRMNRRMAARVGEMDTPSAASNNSSVVGTVAPIVALSGRCCTDCSSAFGVLTISMESPSVSRYHYVSSRKTIRAFLWTKFIYPPLSHLHPWIEETIDEVNNQIHHDDRQGDNNSGALNGWHVLGANRIDRRKPNSRDIEQEFGEERASDDEGERRTDGCHQRVERIAESMPVDDNPLSQAFGAGGAHVILIENVEHSGTRESCEVPHARKRQQDDRCDHVGQCPAIRDGATGQVMQGEEHHEQLVEGNDDESGQREEDQGHAHVGRVKHPRSGAHRGENA